MSHVSEVPPSPSALPAAPPTRPAPAADHAAWLGCRGRDRRGVAGRAVSRAGLRHPRFLAHPDELSIAYLDQVLRQRPDDRSARLLLAGQELALGKWSEAEANLRLLVEKHDDAITWRARLALVELERAGSTRCRRRMRPAARGRRRRSRAPPGRDRADSSLRSSRRSPGSPRWRWPWSRRATPRLSTNAWRARSRRAGASGRCSPAAGTARRVTFRRARWPTSPPAPPPDRTTTEPPTCSRRSTFCERPTTARVPCR